MYIRLIWTWSGLLCAPCIWGNRWEQDFRGTGLYRRLSAAALAVAESLVETLDRSLVRSHRAARQLSYCEMKAQQSLCRPRA